MSLVCPECQNKPNPDCEECYQRRKWAQIIRDAEAKAKAEQEARSQPSPSS